MKLNNILIDFSDVDHHEGYEYAFENDPNSYVSHQTTDVKIQVLSYFKTPCSKKGNLSQ